MMRYKKTKDEVLDTKLEDLKALAPMLRDTMEKDYLCVLGNENRLKENENVFKELVKLNK